MLFIFSPNILFFFIILSNSLIFFPSFRAQQQSTRIQRIPLARHRSDEARRKRRTQKTGTIDARREQHTCHKKKKQNEQNTISVVRARDKNSRSHLRYACLYSPDREIKRQTFEKKKNNLRCFGPNTHDGPQRMWCEPIVDAIRA